MNSRKRKESAVILGGANEDIHFMGMMTMKMKSMKIGCFGCLDLVHVHSFIDLGTRKTILEIVRNPPLWAKTKGLSKDPCKTLKMNQLNIMKYKLLDLKVYHNLRWEVHISILLIR